MDGKSNLILSIFLQLYSSIFCELSEPFVKINFTTKPRSITSLFDIVVQKSGTNNNFGIQTAAYNEINDNFPTNTVLEKVDPSKRIQIGVYNDCFGNIKNCSSGFTFSIWIKLPDGLGDGEYFLFQSGISSFENRFTVLYSKNTGQHSKVEACISAPSSLSLKTYVPNISPSEWFQITVVFHANPCKLVLYKNGVEVSSATLSSLSFTPNDQTSEVTLLRYFKGFVDDLLFWDKPFSVNEVEEHYASYYEDECGKVQPFLLNDDCNLSKIWFDKVLPSCKKVNNQALEICSGILTRSNFTLFASLDQNALSTSCSKQIVVVESKNGFHEECKTQTPVVQSNYPICKYFCNCHKTSCKVLILFSAEISKICELFVMI